MKKPVERAPAPYLAVAVFALLIVVGIYANLHHDYYWNQGTEETCATVTELKSSDSYGNEVLSYCYYVGAVKYTGASTGGSFPCEDANHCIGYAFKITYAVQNPAVVECNLEAPCK